MASRELAEAELVGTIAETKDVAVGVIDVKSYYVETPEDVAGARAPLRRARAARAARVLDRLRPEPDRALGGAAEAGEPRGRRRDRPARARVKEPLLADDAFLADVEAARDEPGLHVWWLGQSGFLLLHDGAAPADRPLPLGLADA